MKRLILFSLIFMFCLPFVYGQRHNVSASWFSALTQGTANDYHVNADIRSDNNWIPRLIDSSSVDLSHNTIWYMNHLDIDQAGIDSNIWHTQMDFHTSAGGVIFAGDIVHFGVTFRVYGFAFGMYRPRLAWWTLNDVFVCPARLIGFELHEPIPFFPVITLFNDMDVELTVQQLEFGVNPTEVPLEDMSPDGLGVPGDPGKYPLIKWVPINEPIKIEPGKSVDIDLKSIGIELKTGEFLEFRYNLDKDKVTQWSQCQY